MNVYTDQPNTDPTPHDAPRPVETGKKEGNFFIELIKFALIAVVIVLPVRMFVAQPFIVSGSSMDPTFADGQYLIVDELTYRLDKPERGDVIVFNFPQDTSKFFIKRIIGLPTETVSIRGNEIKIINDSNPKGFTLFEPYVAHPASDIVTETLGNDEYYVMGDNRAGSSDSRMWGPLTGDFIVGRALVRLFPITSFDFFPGKFETTPVGSL